MDILYLDRLEQIDAATWDCLFKSEHPFIRHAFLTALETSGSATAQTGWTPRHIVVRDGTRTIAAMPCYLKRHSYGEYVFDWAWADAYRRYGIAYYPKLVTAIPFTPATGPRLGIDDFKVDDEDLHLVIQQGIEDQLNTLEGSSWHGYFPSGHLSEAWQRRGWLQRKGVQYHWFNRGYRDFDDFLDTFSSRKRKNLRKERRRVRDQCLDLQRIEGIDLSAEQINDFYHFYQSTYHKRSGSSGYLSLEFFERIRQTMPHNMMMVAAFRNGTMVAAALNFKDSNTLYGRYWGCSEDCEFLHFEACYYQGIDYCIEQGLQRFDPGAQGEHKIQRGFEPTTTWSNHYIRHPQFRAAIADFIQQENQQVSDYIQQSSRLLPFKQTGD